MVPPRIFFTSEDMARKTFLTREEEAVQVWLSTLTADWCVKRAGEPRAYGVNAKVHPVHHIFSSGDPSVIFGHQR